MLTACVLDFEEGWDKYLSLVEFAYNNSYQFSIGMPPFEAPYCRRCGSLICSEKVKDRRIFYPKIIQETKENSGKLRKR